MRKCYRAAFSWPAGLFVPKPNSPALPEDSGLLLLPRGLPLTGQQQNQTHQEQHGQADHAQGIPAGELGEQGHQHGADHRRELAENVKEAKVLVGPLGGNQLAEMGAGDGLNAPLDRKSVV